MAINNFEGQTTGTELKHIQKKRAMGFFDLYKLNTDFQIFLNKNWKQTSA